MPHIVRKSSQIVSRKMYPCIGHQDAGVKVKANFGETEFMWAGAKDLAPKDDEFRRRFLQRSSTGLKA